MQPLSPLGPNPTGLIIQEERPCSYSCFIIRLGRTHLICINNSPLPWARKGDDDESVRFGQAMLTQSVELPLFEAGAVVAADVIKILGVLLEETGEVGVFQDQLPWQSEVVLAQVEAFDVVVAASHVVMFALVQPAQHQILAGGVELARFGTSPC